MRNALDVADALAYSRYAAAALGMRPEERALREASIDTPFAWADADAAIARCVEAGDAGGLAQTLRTVRRQAFVHTLLRDLTGRAGLDEVCATMTRLAESALRAALSLHHGALVAEHGEPRDEAGQAQELVVIGMGKLGGAELNVSSDIDIVFVYPEDGDTDGRRPLPCREFFERLGRRVIGALHDMTPDGYVFRVDVRLRPYGESGPLAVSYPALELYLVTQGRAWERYAWLKARALTGARHDELYAMVAPFVFRKYLDYDAYEGLREIHRQIAEQGKRKDYGLNVKLGPGGIREVEFVVQAVQIVRGGREPELRVRGTLPALAAIGQRGLLPAAAIGPLREAYVFLRNVEHRLQYRDDRQTQMLPTERGERDALARSMGFAAFAGFDAALSAHRAAVKAQFAELFGKSAAGRPDTSSPHASKGRAAESDPGLRKLAGVWNGGLAADTARDALSAAGYADPAPLLASLERLRNSARYVQLPARSQERVDELVPQLLRVATSERVDGADSQTVFQRLVGLLDAVSRRSAYLALLTEHPRILPQLARLMGASQWAADYLTRHPILLDELLDPRLLLAEPDWTRWRAELDRLLVSDSDPERQMDVLRHFQHAQSFRLLAQDLAGTLTVERLADHLSALADAILAATLARVWAQMQGPDGEAPAPPRFAIIGYGKLGGKELGYASDLDLVFLYDDVDELAEERYARLSRRLVTWLTSMTPAGQLYDVDLRLRPDGAKGLVSSTLSGFKRYERENAWTWEHQALTRARFVAGDAAIGAAFEEEREAILRLPRDRTKLAADIVDMRRRMYAGHPNATGAFDLKHDPGGMVDVEFAVQQLVLAHAIEHPRLTRNLGNIALLGIAGELGLVSGPVAHASADAYRDYRRTQHKIRLTGAPHARVDPAAQADRRAAVSSLWVEVFGAPWRIG